jgi:hypothetical protein
MTTMAVGTPLLERKQATRAELAGKVGLGSNDTIVHTDGANDRLKLIAFRIFQPTTAVVLARP